MRNLYVASGSVIGGGRGPGRSAPHVLTIFTSDSPVPKDLAPDEHRLTEVDLHLGEEEALEVISLLILSVGKPALPLLKKLSRELA